ncbi:hypothetical protein B0H14DRAFT_2645140 [Mycena olivaceomarginata]|nr:hypothetical protein B0H14DRAFT_2645140 [Mycena olivaceomarginata]
MASDDDEASQYNDGRGLQFKVELTALAPRPQSGKKPRKNARRPVTKKTFFVHEDSALSTHPLWARAAEERKGCGRRTEEHGAKNENEECKLARCRSRLFWHLRPGNYDMLAPVFWDNRGDDQLTFSWTREGTYSSRDIDIPNLTYSIPKTSFKDMSLTCEDDYQNLLTEVQKKAAPEIVTI